MSSSGVGDIKIINANSKKTSGTIYYLKPCIDEITKCENPFHLEISYDEISYRTIKCYHKNLKNATKGIYYGPFPISEFEFNQVFEFYFSEESCPELARWCEYAPNIHEFVVTESASTQCDLSLAPTRQQTDSEPSSTSNSESQGSTLLEPKVDKFVQEIGIIKLQPCEFDKKLGGKDVRYVMPLKEEMDQCSLDEAFPLECFGDYGSYIIVPCFTSKSRRFPSGTNHDVYTIQLINPNGSVRTMRCYIPHVHLLLDPHKDWEEMLGAQTSVDDRLEMTQNYLGHCFYTIYKKNWEKEDELFNYAVPSQNDIENGKNHFELEIIKGKKYIKVPVYTGDISSFDRNKYIGPYIIEEIKTDGTRGWFNCYFVEGSFLHEKEDPIHLRVQELKLEKDEFESQKNVLLGTHEPRSSTQVKYFETDGVELVRVLRTIKKHDMTGDVLSRSEI